VQTLNEIGHWKEMEIADAKFPVPLISYSKPNMDNSIFDPAAQLARPDFKIIVAMERLSEAFRVLLWEHAKSLGISPIQIQILIFLRYQAKEKCKVGFLAHEFNMTKATVSEAVKTLEQKALLHRQPDPADTRSHSLHLTPAGFDVAAQASLFANPMLQPLSHLSALDQSALLENLLGIIAQLQRAGIISLQRMCFSCRFYQQKDKGHFCQFLDKPLKNGELRVDCTEFEANAN
jgi:DNA-binding MarR family transcriptional regulator